MWIDDAEHANLQQRLSVATAAMATFQDQFKELRKLIMRGLHPNNCTDPAEQRIRTTYFQQLWPDIERLTLLHATAVKEAAAKAKPLPAKFWLHPKLGTMVAVENHAAHILSHGEAMGLPAAKIDEWQAFLAQCVAFDAAVETHKVGLYQLAMAFGWVLGDSSNPTLVLRHIDHAARGLVQEAVRIMRDDYRIDNIFIWFGDGDIDLLFPTDIDAFIDAGTMPPR